MMKKVVLYCIFLCLYKVVSFGQPVHLSSFSRLEKEIVLTEYTTEDISKELVGSCDGQYVYFCKKSAFQNKSTGYDAIVYIVNYRTEEQSVVKLPFPEERKTSTVARKYWIYGLNVCEHKLLLSTQTGVLMYECGSNGDWKLTHTYIVGNLDMAWLDEGTVYAINEDNAYGYNLYSTPLNGREMKRICEFRLRAPFLIQYGPNGFLKKYNHTLYFLNSPDFTLSEYDYNGRCRSTSCFELPNWRNMSNSYIQKLANMPYGSERALFAYHHNAPYSFPLEVIVFNENHCLLSYHQYDSTACAEKLKLLFAERQNDQWTFQETSCSFANNDTIPQNAFPIYFNQPELCLQVGIPNGVIQICKDALVDWRGKSGQDYADEKERFFANHAPVITLRVIKLHDRYQVSQN